MSGTEQRERAEAALDHVRHAAREMIAAARDTLDLLDDVVSTTDLSEVLAGFNQVARSMFERRPSAGPTPPEPQSNDPVEHISVR